MTELDEPATSAMSVQKCLTHSIRRRHLMNAGDNCNPEALILRTFSPRFMHLPRTAEFSHSLTLPEAARSMIETEALALNNASAMKKKCVDFVVRAVGRKWQMIEFPAEFMSLPVGQEVCLESQKKKAFSTLHISILEIYKHLSTMLMDRCHRQPLERL